MRTVPVGQIGGSVGRCSEFDGDFLPAKPSVRKTWKRVDRVFHLGEELPAVSLYKVGGFYFVLDGHHRVSVAQLPRRRVIDAYVTEFGAGGGIWSERRGRKTACVEESTRRGEPELREMMDSHLKKQRREELLHEVEMNRRAKLLPATRKRRDGGRRSAVVWEMKRQAGRLLKVLRRTLRNAGY
jgi:hypothetical protein